jgi:predicted CXXCH cytochrome family protein
VTEGKCVDCHQSHQSNRPNLLPVPERELCLKCHPDVLADLRAAEHVHEPLKEECGGCHAGHGGVDRSLLREPARDLCLGCHEPLLAAGHTRGDVHPPLADGASCLDCHQAHAAALPGLVVGDVSAACYGCHAREMPLDGGRKIADVKSEVAGARFVHEPVAKGACNACHSGHASPHGDLLAKPYPEGIYADFSERAFDLCFGSCHDASLVTAERTTATRFRDGDRNLHYVHVHQRKSRTCALCHRAHASDLPALTRDRVPFGPHGWPLAIGFRRTDEGGTCASGCHQEIGYRNGEPAGGVPVNPGAPGDGENK